MAHEWRKFQVAIGNVWCGWSVPYFNLPSYTYCEMSTRWRKSERRHIPAQRKVVEYDATRDIGKDCVTVFVDGEEEISARV